MNEKTAEEVTVSRVYLEFLEKKAKRFDEIVHYVTTMSYIVRRSEEDLTRWVWQY